MSWLANLFKRARQSSGEGDFIGRNVDFGNEKLRIRKVIAEGGSGIVFVAQNLTTRVEYALKRLTAPDDVTSTQIVKEISFLRKLRGHGNIVEYIGAASRAEHNGTVKEYLILTELCPQELVVYMKSQHGQPLPFTQVLKIFAQLSTAVIYMHQQTPPIIHRDLKLENVLFSSKGTIKLCDYGSATTDAIYPDTSWSALERTMCEEEIERNTTPMYRSPEMVDLYSNYPITVKADTWALGCLLYSLCFIQHPFADSSKLKIMNGDYTIPESDEVFRDFHHIIASLLQVDPGNRGDAEDIYAELVVIGCDRNVNLEDSVIDVASRPVAPTTGSSSFFKLFKSQSS